MTNKMKCPQCGEWFNKEAASTSKPFCSERCKLIDLGAWADGRYSIPAEESPMSEQTTTTDEHSEH